MIKPEDINKAKAKLLNKDVEQAVDFLLARNWTGTSSTIILKDICKKAFEIANPADMIYEAYERYLYDNKMLDIEEAYREAGWKVYFDRPAYNETYQANFMFSRS